MIGKIISKDQTTFILGKNILDGVLVVNKVLGFAKRKRRSCLVLKVDYEKAYDSISWKYLRFSFDKMGFGNKWKDWMQVYVFNSSMSILVNGSATKNFRVEKGLRQGDLLSPFLFVIAMGGLTGLTNKIVELGEYSGFHFNEDILIDILQFADDTILIGDEGMKSLWGLKSILKGFEMVFGLKVNFFKSKIYGINLDERSMNAVVAFLSSCEDHTPFKFLGVKVGYSPRRVHMWKDVINNIAFRLAARKNRLLSFGGKVVLINIMLNYILIS